MSHQRKKIYQKNMKYTGGAGYKVQRRALYKVQRRALYKVQWSEISRIFTEKVPL